MYTWSCRLASTDPAYLEVRVDRVTPRQRRSSGRRAGSAFVAGLTPAHESRGAYQPDALVTHGTQCQLVGSGSWEGALVVKVFLVDDHEVVRRGLVDLLGADPELDVVGEAGFGRRGDGQVPAARPDVAVLDVRLPDGNG